MMTTILLSNQLNLTPQQLEEIQKLDRQVQNHIKSVAATKVSASNFTDKGVDNDRGNVVGSNNRPDNSLSAEEGRGDNC